MDPRAIPVLDAYVAQQGENAVVLANGDVLTTPAGHPVEFRSLELAEAIAEELVANGVADVTRPSLYAFYSTQRDFIEPDPERTIEALVELLAHDYLLHPAEGLGRRQVQVAAWQPQIDLWRRVADQDPPFAGEMGDPPISRAAYGAFHSLFDAFSPAQLAVAMYTANLLKSATLGMLLAQRAIDEDRALEAAAVTPRLLDGESQEELERQQEREEDWQRVILLLLRFAGLNDRGQDH